MNLPKFPYPGVNIPEGGDGKKGQMPHIILLCPDTTYSSSGAVFPSLVCSIYIIIE